MSDIIMYKTTRPAPVEEKPSLVDGAGYKGIPWYENFVRWATEESTVPVPENPGYWNYSPMPTPSYDESGTVPAPENPGYWNYSPMPTLTYGASGTVFDEALNRTENRELQRHQPEPYQSEPDPSLTHLVSALLVTGGISLHPLTTHISPLSPN